MLPYALAIAVGLSSLVLFSTAFIMSDIHRQDDFFWSGVGLFYALVLWFCATRLTGGVLLGQAAAVALVVSNNWQTIKLRKAIANPEAAEKLNKFSVLSFFGGVMSRKKAPAKVAKTETPTITDKEIAIPDRTSEEKLSESQTATPQSETLASKVAQKPKQGLFGKFFGGKKQQPSPPTKKEAKTPITETKIDEILDLENAKIIDTQTIPEPVVEKKEVAAKEPQAISTPVVETSPVVETESEEVATAVSETIAEEPQAVSAPVVETSPATETKETSESQLVSEPETEDTNYIAASKIVDIIDVEVEQDAVKSPAENVSQTSDIKEATVTPTTPEPASDASPIVEVTPQEITTTPEIASPEVTENKKTTPEIEEKTQSSETIKKSTPGSDIGEFLEEMDRQQNKSDDSSEG